MDDKHSNEVSYTDWVHDIVSRLNGNMNLRGKHKSLDSGRRLKIVFMSAELARSCNDDEERLRVYGPQLAPMLRRRLCEISAAGHLAELRSLPAARLRADPVRQDGWLLVALGRWADLRVRPREEPLPTLSDGRLDEVRIRELLVSEVAVA